MPGQNDRQNSLVFARLIDLINHHHLGRRVISGYRWRRSTRRRSAAEAGALRRIGRPLRDEIVARLAQTGWVDDGQFHELRLQDAGEFGDLAIARVESVRPSAESGDVVNGQPWTEAANCTIPGPFRDRC
jgi:hypothetical protein